MVAAFIMASSLHFHHHIFFEFTTLLAEGRKENMYLKVLACDCLESQMAAHGTVCIGDRSCHRMDCICSIVPSHGGLIGCLELSGF